MNPERVAVSIIITTDIVIIVIIRNICNCTANSNATHFVLLNLKEIFAISMQAIFKVSALLFRPQAHWI